MIKAVIFDVGGVLVRTMNRNGRNRLEARLGLDPGESEQIFFNSEMGTKAQTGHITSAEHLQWLQSHLNLSDSELDDFQRDFWDGDRLDTELVDFIRQLQQHYQTAIISNAQDNLLHFVTDLYPMADAFGLIVGSAYEKVMKPAPAIYEQTLARLGREAHEAVFIDDFAHNIAGAKAVGMHGIHFQPEIDLPQELAKLGVQLSS